MRADPGATVRLRDLAELGHAALRDKHYPMAKQIITTLFKQVPRLPPPAQPYVYSMAKLLAAMAAVDTYRGQAVQLQGEATSPLLLAHEWAQRAIQDAESVGHPWPAAYSFLAMICSRLGRLEDAIAAGSRAVALDPSFWQGWNNLGDALLGSGAIDAAEAAFAEAARLKPGEPSLRFNRGLIRLIRGDYETGFTWYEARWNILEWQRDHGRPFHATHPQWWGEPLLGRRLLLHAEQGHGDLLQQLRYVPWVLTFRPAALILEVHDPLERLVRRRLPQAGACEIVPFGALPAFDLWCPMMSLGAVHRTTLATIPPPAQLRR